MTPATWFLVGAIAALPASVETSGDVRIASVLLKVAEEIDVAAAKPGIEQNGGKGGATNAGGQRCVCRIGEVHGSIEIGDPVPPGRRCSPFNSSVPGAPARGRCPGSLPRKRDSWLDKM